MSKRNISILSDSLLKKMFDFKGRSGKKEYFIFTIFELIIFIPLLLLERKYGRTPLLNTLAIISVLIYFIPYTALATRRLHDFNLKGWWFFLSLVFSPIIFLMFCFIKGDLNKNKYGEPPRD